MMDSSKRYFKNLLWIGKLLKIVFGLFMVLLMVGGVEAQTDEETPITFQNPLNVYRGPDPWLTYYEGNYYLATTTGTSELTMQKSPTIAGLKSAMVINIYAETEASRCCNMWAPEFHLLDGPNGPRWYFYYTAGTAGTLDNQHTHVLESVGTDPLGPYTYKARIFDPQNDVWAIDGSVLQMNASLYFLFSSWVGSNQSMYIAPMSDPWTLSGERVLISKPDYAWEKVGLNVNEGPVALQHEGKTFIIYSASYCNTPDYKLGLLTYNGGDPLNIDSWDKSPEPVFERSDENGVYGPGHNGFFKSPDGTEDWIVYHANSSVTAGCSDSRTTRVQKFRWNADGTPDFGVPVSVEQSIEVPAGDMGAEVSGEDEQQMISRFKSYNLRDGYLRHADSFLRIDTAIDPLADSLFYVVPGLADPEAVSIMAVNFPGYYLRRQGNSIILSASDASETFNTDAMWWLKPGLADSEWISFEAYDQPDRYLGQKFGLVAMIELSEASTDLVREDATFLQEIQ